MNRVIAGRYELKQRLGAGGMAMVYLAHDPLLSRDVAIKLPRVDDDGDGATADRFRAELQASGRLNHPNIVTIYDGGQDGDQLFLVMEPVDGESLAELVRREGPLPATRAVAIARQVAEALAYAHSQGLVHRDVKPQNVLLDRAGRAKVTDFGIARSSGDVTRTLVGTIVGTPAYVAPEVTAGQRATALSDIYSIGILLYFMLTAHTPFESENPIAEVVRSQQEDPQPPSVLAPVPAWLDAVVLHAIARKPENRYQSAAALASDLAEAKAPAHSTFDATGTMVLDLPDKPRPPKRRKGIRFALGVVAAATLLGILGGAAVFGQHYLETNPLKATATPAKRPRRALLRRRRARTCWPMVIWSQPAEGNQPIGSRRFFNQSPAIVTPGARTVPADMSFAGTARVRWTQPGPARRSRSRLDRRLR